jgi:hypothetical protein
MKEQILSAFGLCMIAGLSVAVFADATEAAQQRSRRECRQEWRAHRATFRADGKTRRTFMRACRAGTMQPPAPQKTGKGA